VQNATPKTKNIIYYLKNTCNWFFAFFDKNWHFLCLNPPSGITILKVFYTSGLSLLLSAQNLLMTRQKLPVWTSLFALNVPERLGFTGFLNWQRTCIA